MKQYPLPHLYAIMKHHNNVPQKINTLLSRRKIQAGFVSSIVSKKYTAQNIGIIGYKKISSVLVCKDKNSNDLKKDKESATSNALAKALGLTGQTIIGDKALKIYIDNPNKCQDLAKHWYEKYKLPFVFGVFCSNSNNKFYKKLTKQFIKRKIKIPYYILQKNSVKLKIPKREVINYISQIKYKIGAKERRALNIFLRLAKAHDQ